MCAVTASCSSPDPGTISLRFEHRIDGQRIALDTEYTTRYAQQVTFDHIRFWASNIYLTSGEEALQVADSYFLVEQTPQNTQMTLEVKVPADTYDTFAFHIGVDPGPNASLDEIAGDLAPGIGMDWSWDTGYKFFRTEGQFAEQGVEGRFVMHTGNDGLYKRVQAELPEPLVLEEGGRVELTARSEFDRVFAGIELSETPEILGGTADSLAGKVAGNYGRMWTLITAAGDVRMTATSPNIGGGTGNEDIPIDSTSPALTEPVIDVGNGQLVCDAVADRPASRERGCMTPFLLGAGDAYQDAGFLTFVTNNDAPVRASSPGVVHDVHFLDHSNLTHSDLFMVVVRPNEDSAFFLEYRNVKNLTVQEGDQVTAGQVLGGAGDYFAEDRGIVSFAVRRQQHAPQRMCPTAYMSSSLLATYQNALEASNVAWPDYAHTELCEVPGLVCAGEVCDKPGDFQVTEGDVNEGWLVFEGGCASCHGSNGEGDIGPTLCFGPGCVCLDCADFATLAQRIEEDMPPEGYCDPDCAAAAASYIIFEFATAARSAAVETLGQRLFFDKRLSANDRVSCATCHDPSRAYTDGIALSDAGVSGNTLERHAPSLLDLARHDGYFWEGGSKNLESQVFGPLTNPDEMGQDVDELMEELAADALYPMLFRRAFDDGLTLANVARAIAQFERTLVSGQSRYDRDELTFSERRGLAVFGELCAGCHTGRLFTDHRYYNNGLDDVFPQDNERLAWGRARISHADTDIGKFKVPSLRNIAVTAPYMHDGRFETLESVVEHYRSGIEPSETLDGRLRQSLLIDDTDARDLVAFLRALTDDGYSR